MSSPLAPRDTKQTAEYLTRIVEAGTTNYARLCLKLQREARGLPAIYPTAYTASQATPRSERITNINDLRRGMVAFSYDPRIPGTAGHIFFINGRTPNGNIVTTSNDVKIVGAVDIVPFSLYKSVWGQSFQFGATWLNGYDFSDFNKPPEPVHKGGLGTQYDHAIEDIEKILARKKKKLGKDHRLVKILEKDLARMKKRDVKWS